MDVRFPSTGASTAAIYDVKHTERVSVMPALCRRRWDPRRGAGVESLVRRKPRGGRGAVWLGGSYREFWGRGGIAYVVAGGWKAADDLVRSERRRAREARMQAAGVGAAAGERLGRSRGHRVRAPACGWRRRRSGVARRAPRRLSTARVSILIRVGDGERAGRARQRR